MFSFCQEKDTNAFEEFVLSNGGIYLQSAKWAKVKTTWNNYMYSGFDNKGERVLTALILERNLPFAGKIWYCPAGCVCDYNNRELLKEFSVFIKREMKNHSALALFFDPCVVLRINGEYEENGKEVHKLLLDCNFTLNTDASKCLYKAPVQLITLLKDKDSKPFTPEKHRQVYDDTHQSSCCFRFN